MTDTTSSLTAELPRHRFAVPLRVVPSPLPHGALRRLLKSSCPINTALSATADRFSEIQLAGHGYHGRPTKALTHSISTAYKYHKNKYRLAGGFRRLNC
jgi:hypothetical protein